MEDESNPVKEAQRRLNPKVWEAVKEEIHKWRNAEIIYPISDSQLVSLVHVVPKKVRVIVTINEKGDDPNMPTDKVTSLYQLPEVECHNEEGSLSLTIHRQDHRLIGRSELYLLLGWILWLQRDCSSSGRSREDNVYMSLSHVHF